VRAFVDDATANLRRLRRAELVVPEVQATWRSRWQRLLFGFTLPLSKSVSTAVLVALYALAAAAMARNGDFRADVSRSCRQPTGRTTRCR
jgi:hypothetical protein